MVTEIHSEQAVIKLGFSPCPNDCFIFDALVNGKIDTEGLQFEMIMDDVEALNQRGFRAELDVTKLSFFAYAFLTKKYQLLNSGSALGNNCGPLLITKVNDISYFTALPADLKIAIPGKYTTANLLLSIALPDAKKKIEYLFSEIEEAVLSSKVNAGLIIHENRFTYEQKGLKKVMDLGEFWESIAHAPIPLGGIAIKRTFSPELKHKIDRLIRKSVEFAFANPKSSSDFVKKNAQEMNEEVMYKHIDLYVNKYSIDLGTEGRRAVELLFKKAQELDIIEKINEEVFLD